MFDAPNRGLSLVRDPRNIGNTIMRTFRQRVWVAFLATTCGLAVGGCAGYLLGRTITIKQTGAKLEEFAKRAIEGRQKLTGESRRVLAAMNASPFPKCSDAEIGYFNKLIFESHYLKAGGRMSDGRIECSTSLGRAAQSHVQYQPDIYQRDGTRMYRNLAPFRVGNETVLTIQLGDFYVVYNPYNMRPPLNNPTQFTVTDLDAPNWAAGESYLFQDGQHRDGDRLYGTDCSPDGMVCVAAYIPIPQAMLNNRIEVGGFVALGGLTGILLGFVCAVIYRRQRGFESQLLRAIRKDALRIVYQPIVDLENEQIVEVEALARWTNEDNEPVSPDDFIKVAEERGFVGKITRLVVRHVLRDFGKTLRERPGFRVNVNIAAADLADPEFLPMLEGALAEAGVAASSLGIEITESYTARQQVAKETILRLREKGHYVHIDDFGTGYSSLAYLHDLSVDAIKIDKAFTKAIGTDAVTVTILPQILTMADSLGLRVIVEGIETPQQARYFAKADQSIYAQGWLFGRPVPPDAFLRLLEGKTSSDASIDSIEGLGVVASTVPAL
jgi:sensor c-di-GMP phosphodiesterase-like protein